ncbi:MAG: methyltransferase [Deltaproteobacteria bacterium]|nr:methyltransferase [Candidatus Anaeroferrophillacea bacterium]
MSDRGTPAAAVTSERLAAENLEISQPRTGYRYGADPFLLAAEVNLRPGQTLLDIGTGVGIIPLLLARRFPAAGPFTGIEIQAAPAALARENVRQNGLQDRIRIVTGDIRRPLDDHLPPGTFALITANPPYYPQDRGRLNPCPEKAVARHELTLDLPALCRAARRLLASGGILAIIFPAGRLPELLQRLRETDLEPKRLRCVHGASAAPADRVIVTAKKGGRPGLEIAPPHVTPVPPSGSGNPARTKQAPESPP